MNDKPEIFIQAPGLHFQMRVIDVEDYKVIEQAFKDAERRLRRSGLTDGGDQHV